MALNLFAVNAHEQFEGTKYVFTLGDNDQTVVEEFQAYDDTWERVLKNVAVGAGVIVVCVVVAAVTYGAGAPAVAAIFMASAKTGAAFAVSGAAIGAVAGGVVTAIETDGDLEATLKSAALSGSEGFKWGAITGALKGGSKEASSLYRWHKLTNLSYNDIARIQRDSRYSLDFIRSVSSYDEYNVYKNADLVEFTVGDKRVLVPRDFNPDFIDPATQMTNRELMLSGKNPVDPSGMKYEWHHVGQKTNSPLALLTDSQHNDYDEIIHLNKISSEVRPGGDDSAWRKLRQTVNKLVAENLFK